jgi:hypothetical protein
MPHKSLNRIRNEELQEEIDRWHNSPELSNVRLFNPTYNKLINEYEKRCRYQIQ